jgi:A/G-specific adenine glycosylase
VLEWGAAHRRDLPWRATRDPWSILVSEVMLQQTQVDRVISYYEAFLAAFPTPVRCARARSGDVVRLWSGLGYNRRALNLHRAAVTVAQEFGGEIPEDERDLRTLAGVGPYTARAVQAFAFELDVAPVDTNVARIVARCVVGAGVTIAETQTVADRLLPLGRSWEFNQAMFDLGATVCTATRPSCGACPLRRQCRWKRRGLTDPDPWRASPSARPQSPFAGSDREGRGRLVDALRHGGVSRDRLPAACGWAGDRPRAERIANALVSEGFARWSTGRVPQLRLQ